MTVVDELTYGYVRGRFSLLVGDDMDGDALPDRVPAIGKVRFTPAVNLIKEVGADPGFVIPQQVIFETNAAGRLVDTSGNEGVWLATGVWNVSFSFAGALIPGFTIQVTTDHTEQTPLYLVLHSPHEEPSPYTVFVVNEQIYVDTVAARDAAQAAQLAAEEARDEASQIALGGVLISVDDIIATGTPSSSTFLRGDSTWTSLSGTYALVGHQHVQGDVTGLVTTLDGKVDTSDPRLTDARVPLAHEHPIGDVTGLTTALDGKVDVSDPRLTDARTPTAHEHPVGEISATGTPSSTTFLRGDGSWASVATGTYAPLDHQHAQADVTGLVTTLASKVDTSDPRLTDARTPTAHQHVQGDVTGLTTTLAGKVNTSDPRLTDARTPTAHQHPVGDINASGTPSSSTYLRGDGSWMVPPGDGSAGNGNLIILESTEPAPTVTEPTLLVRYGL